MSLETKKEQVELTKKRGGQLKTYSIKDELSKLQNTASKKKDTHPPHSKVDEKPREPFKEKYRGLLKSTPEYFPAKKTGGKKDSTVTKKVEQPEESRIVLMDIDPYRLHAYWEIAHVGKKRILAQLDEPSHPPRQIIRVYDVTYIHFDGKNAPSYFDIEIDKDKGNWYINLWSPHKSFCAEIGMRSIQGDFYPLARSNFIDTPRPYQSTSAEEQWMKVSGDYEEFRILSAKPQTEEIKLEDTLPQRENLISITQKGKGLQEPDLKRTHISLSKKEIESKSTPSVGKELTLERNIVGKNLTLTTSQSHEEKIPSVIALTKTQEKRSYEKNKRLFIESEVTKESIKSHLLENEVKAYYRKFLFIARHQGEKTQTFPATNPHHERFIPLEEDPNQRLSTKRYTHYGSDIRWEEETIRLNDRGKEESIIAEVIRTKHITK